MHPPATCPEPLKIGDPLFEDFTAPSGLSAPPVVVRLAGLPAQAIEPLTSPSCIALLQAGKLVEEELGEARQAMVEVIGHALSRFDAATRRFLLAIKRSCFNGREIGKYSGKTEWAELLRVSPGLAERIVTLEEQLRDHDRSFTILYESELTRERRHVLALIQDRRFLRGVALGRPGLVEKARSRVLSFAASGSLKSPEKWELSLLRFVTRAAAKLSANSTLTTYALGSVQASSSRTGFRFVGSPQREVSLVRLNRPEVEQLQTLLMRHPAARERGLVAWNDSLEELEPGRYCFLRDGHWSLEPGAKELLFAKPARITVNLSEALIDAARDALQEGALRYDAFLALLENGHGISDRSDLDELVDLGFFILLPPWPTHEACLEQRIGQFLRTLPDEPALRATADALDELLALEESFASAARPESSVAEMKDAFLRLLETAAHLVRHEGPLTARVHFFEDVLLEPEPSLASTANGGIFQISSPLVQDILQTADLVARFAGLFNLRHDVLHTLAAWWREHEPSRREAPFTEIARGFAPAWKQFIRFYTTAYEDALNTFDPLHAASLKTLRERRKTILARSRQLLSASPAKDFLPPRQLEELVEALPHRYAPQLGACVFVQPLDAAGSSWVLNRLHEGTGRYLSRIIPVLEESLQRRFLDHLTARSVVEVEGEEADLLEVKYPWTYLVRAHPPQAKRVLDIRGLHLDLPQERRVSLGDLTVQANLDSETFRLIDASGRRVLPVNLSTLSDNGHSNLLRFLLAFGPGETRSVLPLTHVQGDEDFRSFNRLTCGKLVLCRRRWMIGIERLRASLEGLTDPRAYIVIQDWRRRLDLPVVGFYQELTHYGKPKPQYVDFSSPSQCRLFVASLQKMTARHLNLEEALPPPTGFPLDASMNRRAFELLIDSLAIRAISGNSPAEVRYINRESPSLRRE